MDKKKCDNHDKNGGKGCDNDAVSRCSHCGKRTCLECMINWARGGGDGGAGHQNLTPNPEAVVCECPYHRCRQPIDTPEILTEKFWRAQGITDYQIYCMIVSTIITGAQMHW